VTVRTFAADVTPLVLTRRYNPGHYASMMRANDSQAQMTAATVPGITKGFLKRWAWYTFESALNNYSAMDTHELHSDLAYCQARGLKLIVMIEDITYGNPTDNTPQPPYLNSWSVDNNVGGVTICRWDSFVHARWKLLLTEFAARFGSHPALEGIMREETSLVITNTQLTTPAVDKLYEPYTPEIYRTALLDGIEHALTVMPLIRYFFYMNFMPMMGADHDSGLYLEDVVEAHKPDIVICGPDAEETNAALETRTFWIYRDHAATCPVMAHLSTQVYDQASAPTGEQMYQFATGSLGANYICSIFQGAAHNNWVNKIVPMMNAHPTFNVETW
jgi:hypothetical protein